VIGSLVTMFNPHECRNYFASWSHVNNPISAHLG
jgi:hypothetical protein